VRVLPLRDELVLLLKAAFGCCLMLRESVERVLLLKAAFGCCLMLRESTSRIFEPDCCNVTAAL